MKLITLCFKKCSYGDFLCLKSWVSLLSSVTWISTAARAASRSREKFLSWSLSWSDPSLVIEIPYRFWRFWHNIGTMYMFWRVFFCDFNFLPIRMGFKIPRTIHQKTPGSMMVFTESRWPENGGQYITAIESLKFSMAVRLLEGMWGDYYQRSRGC